MSNKRTAASKKPWVQEHLESGLYQIPIWMLPQHKKLIKAFSTFLQRSTPEAIEQMKKFLLAPK